MQNIVNKPLKRVMLNEPIYKSGGGSPVSTSAMRDHLRFKSNIEDTLIDSMLKASTEKCEIYTRRSFKNTVWELSLRGFSSREIRLKKSPLISVDSITYKDVNGVSQTFPVASYQVQIKTEPGIVALLSTTEWPDTEDGRIDAVQITFTSGYGTLDGDTPEGLRSAIKIYAAHLFENRDMTTTAPGFAQTIPFPIEVKNILNDYALRAMP